MIRFYKILYIARRIIHIALALLLAFGVFVQHKFGLWTPIAAIGVALVVLLFFEALYLLENLLRGRPR